MPSTEGEKASYTGRQAQISTRTHEIPKSNWLTAITFTEQIHPKRRDW